MTVPKLSDQLAQIQRKFAGYSTAGIVVTPVGCATIATEIAQLRELAEWLEAAEAERNDLRAIARDLDLLGAETLPPIDLMRLVAQRAIEEAGGNVVIFPGLRRHLPFLPDGGAA